MDNRFSDTRARGRLSFSGPGWEGTMDQLGVVGIFELHTYRCAH